MLQAVLTANTFKALQNDGISSNVESIEVTKVGYEIDTNLPADVEYFYEFEEIITPA